MADAVHNQLIADLAREVVAQAAPQELPLFQALSAAYFKDPDKALKRQATQEEKLGFGVGEVAIFLTPIALELTKDLVTYIAEHVLQTVKDESARLATDAVKHLFKKFRPVEKDANITPPLLTPGQIAQVRRHAFEKARQLNLPEAQAALLADAVAGSLIMASA